MIDWRDGAQPWPAKPAETAEQKEARRTRMLAAAREIWSATVDPAGTLLEIYLWSRQLRLRRVPSTLRLHYGLWHRESGEKRPAMVARIDHPERGFVAVHATYLTMDGSAKASLVPVRKTFGLFSGGAVRFGSPRSDRWLIVGEGLETVLSVAFALGCPGWAALSWAGLVAMRLPPAARQVLIAADNDLDDTGIEAAERAARRWAGEGRRIRVIAPPTPGTDWNDVLRGAVSHAL
jgi:putative DNA primase/helicase